MRSQDSHVLVGTVAPALSKSLAFDVQTREVLDAMLKDAKMPSFKLLRVDGGASQNNLLMQLQADAIQVRLTALQQGPPSHTQSLSCLARLGGYS